MTVQLNAAIAAAIAQAAQEEDHTKVGASGEGYKPPAEGKVFVRFVQYLELGKSTYEYQGKPKVKDNVRLVFEIPPSDKYPGFEYEEDGVKKVRPQTLTINANKTQGANGGWIQLVGKLNHDKSITHVAQALGRAFKVEIIHNKKEVNGKEVVYANINRGKEYLIEPAVREVTDDEGNITKEPAKVKDAISPILCFLWDYADMEQWNSLYIPGEYDEVKDEKTGEVVRPKRSKNVIQERIKQATNFIGSPIYNLLQANGQELDVGDVEDHRAAAEATTSQAQSSASAEAGADPLEGIA